MSDDAMEQTQDRLTGQLASRLAHAAVSYEPGMDHDLPFPDTVPSRVAVRRGRAHRAAERLRDIWWRVVYRLTTGARERRRAGLERSLPNLLENLAGLEETYRLLDDEESRRLLVNLLAFRVLGPRHVRLPLTPGAYRKLLSRAEAELLVGRRTIEVSDPFIPYLNTYRVRCGDGDALIEAELPGIAATFLLEQYRYDSDEVEVEARAGDVVVDAGGCFGDTALYFAGRVGTTGRVYTFEFSPGNLEVLERNLTRNPDLGDRVEVVKAALFDRPGTLSFEDHGRLSRLVPSGDRTRQVRALPLDVWARETGLTRVDMIKMDIEGAEPAALRGAREILERYRPNLAIAAYHAAGDLVTLPRFLASLGLGYRMFLGHYSARQDETVLFATVRPSPGQAARGLGMPRR